MTKPSLCWLAALALPGGLLASQTNNPSAAQAAPWLLISDNSRQAAMGDVFVATANDADALGEAPAALAQVPGQQLDAGQNLWLQGVGISHLAYAANLVGGGALGLGINYVNVGSVDSYLVSNGTLVANGTLNPSAYDLDLGWGQSIGLGLDLGVDVKSVSEDLGGAGASAVAVDASAQWDSGLGLKLGLAAQNVGSQLGGADLPDTVVAGLAYGFGGSASPYLLALDVDMPSEGDVSVGLGAEAWINPVLALRLGYHSNDTATNDMAVSGLTAGMGLKASWMEIDYAYRAEGDLGDANQFSVKTNF
jgi:hypothetical protein